MAFSAIVWILVQFSKTYTQLIEIPVNFINVPLDKSLAEKRPDHVDLQLQDNGFSIYYYKFFNTELDIDLSKATENEDFLVYNIQNHLTDLEDQLKVDLGNSRIVQEEIRIPFQFKKEKVLSIEPKFNISYAVGFSADNPVELIPDTVRVSGPQNIIDSLESISTLQVNLTNVNSDIAGTVKIDTTGFGMLSFYENSIDYSQKVEKFTEGSVEIPVKVINVPANLNLAFFPKSVIVYYQVNLKRFDKVSAADFEVVCDFKELKEGDDFMVAKIVTQPKFTTNVRLNERKIQFVIKR
nr:CdaR family protein [Gramella sp. AN32]